MGDGRWEMGGVEVRGESVDDWRVSKVEQIEIELKKLSKQELFQIRNWLDDLLEDELEFTPEFEAAVQKSESEMAKGASARVREP